MLHVMVSNQHAEGCCHPDRSEAINAVVHCKTTAKCELEKKKSHPIACRPGNTCFSVTPEIKSDL